jgi:uncharacterized protein (TIGR02687 family)
MNPESISSSLNKIFDSNKPQDRIVFWNDEGGKFQEILEELALENVTLVHLERTSALELKIRLELEDLTGRYLIYSALPPPSHENDWLLNIRLHSRVFHADSAAMALQELGLNQLSLREHLKQREAFLKSKTRFESLKKLIDQNDKEIDIDTKMIAVTVGTGQSDFFDILIRTFQDPSFLEQLDDNQSKIWTDIKKFSLEETFWKLIEDTFSYARETPRLKDLLIRLFVTDFVDSVKAPVPSSLDHFVIQNNVGRNNASVFLSSWRNNVSRYSSYDRIARILSQELQIARLIDRLDEQALSNCMTFLDVEEKLLRLIRDDLVSDVLVKPDELKTLSRMRREGHWANKSLKSEDEPDNRYSLTYDALETAADILYFRRIHDDVINFKSAQNAFEAYTKDFFRMDQLYRLFHEVNKELEKLGIEIVKDIVKKIEDCYCHWYLDQLAVSWSSLMKPSGDSGLLERWNIQTIPNQYDFYEHFIRPHLKPDQRTRVYVIISDAFRYEAAEELYRDLNSKYRMSADLKSMLGVVPSYTALGMSALSPRQSLSFKPESADIMLVDGQPFSTMEERSKVLAKYEAVAIKANELSSMTKEAGREFVKNYRLIYVYDNIIDAIGESPVTESTVFEAVRTAIKRLSRLVKFIVNNLNGNHVFVTTDHGFLYQESASDAHVRTDIQVKPASALKSKKRYILGQGLGTTPEAWTGNTSKTARTNPGLDFWIPKGRNLFHFTGGSRFVHGGAMPQEIVIPVIHVKSVKGAAAGDTETKKVDVHLLTDFQKMVTNTQKLEFLQTEPVKDRRQPRILTVSLRDGDKLISNEITLTFDSSSDTIEERKRFAVLKIISGNYDSKREYTLVLRDQDEIEYKSFPVKIDISFLDDFS